MGVGTHGHWSVQVVGGWMGVAMWGVLNRCFFYTPKKTIHLGKKRQQPTSKTLKKEPQTLFILFEN
mgnify:CR=1 FL=1